MVSTKFYSDYDETEVFANNWAYEGEVSLERLKQLEISFLTAIQWNLLVSHNEFYEKLKTVEKLLALKEGLSRSWFTYTEMNMLMPSIEAVKQILNYTTVLMFTYVCSITAVVLSSMILTTIPMTLSPSSTSTPTNEINATTENIQILKSCEALLPNVMMISVNDDNDDVDQTECTFNESILLLDSDDENISNFTIDFSLFNEFEWEMKKNYQDITNHFGMFPSFNPVPLVW